MMLEVGQISSKIGTAVRSVVLGDKQVIQTTYDFQPILENHQPKQGQNGEILTVRLMVRGRSPVQSRSLAPLFLIFKNYMEGVPTEQGSDESLDSFSAESNKLLGPEVPRAMVLEALRSIKSGQEGDARVVFQKWSDEKEQNLDLQRVSEEDRLRFQIERASLYIDAGMRNQALDELELVLGRTDNDPSLSFIIPDVDVAWDSAKALPKDEPVTPSPLVDPTILHYTQED